MKKIEDAVEAAFEKLTAGIDQSKLLTEEEKQALDAAEQKRQSAFFAQCRLSEMNAPKRIILNRKKLNYNTEWGKAAESLKKRIGTGTLLVLRGKPGTGKSQLAVELMIHGITEKELKARFVTFSEIQLKIKEGFSSGRGENGEGDIIRALIKPDILTIDEFDWCPDAKENVTDDYWQRLMYHVINERYNDMKDTLLTSNKPADVFAATTIIQIKSRIAETGGMVTTDAWTDWRWLC